MNDLERYINPNSIVLAREYRQISQKNLAKDINMSQGQLSKVENGIMPLKLNDENLLYIANRLDFPIEFFVNNYNIIYFSNDILYRKRATKTIGKKLNAEFNIIYSNIKKILDTLELLEVKNFTEFSDYRDICSIVKSVKKNIFNIDNNLPVYNLSELLENSGCIIYRINFDIGNINGFTSYLLKNNRPLIFINNNYSLDNFRFTLAHEFGHIVLHSNKEQSQENEKEANEFASEFLMPKESILNDFNNKYNKLDNLDTYIPLKLKWNTSIQSLIKRAKELGCISDGQYKALQVNISRYGWRKDEPCKLDDNIETSNLLKEIFYGYYNDLGYTANDFKKLFSLNSKDILKFFGNLMPDDLKLNLKISLFNIINNSI